MIDTLLANLDRFDARRLPAAGLDLPDRYVVATLHRPANVDVRRRLGRWSRRCTAVADQVAGRAAPAPARPRAADRRRPVRPPAGCTRVDPLGYVEFLGLVRGAALVVTDSGGVQEETTVLGVPCLTLRPNTERPVTITHGTNRLVDAGGAARPGRRGAGRRPAGDLADPAALGRRRRRRGSPR